MAKKDVLNYYQIVCQQYQQITEDLADFQKGLEDGYVTEDQLSALKDEVYTVELNKNRIAYLLYLLDMPNRPAKKPKYKKANRKLAQQLADLQANQDSVIAENQVAINMLEDTCNQLQATKI